jgi:transposase
VHARSVVDCAIDVRTGELIRARLVPQPGVVLDWLRGLPGPVAVAYEAGPTGFGLARACEQASIPCVVAAPSKLQRPSGDRVKTDARDPLHLARLLQLGQIVGVAVPSVDQEAARDLVRAREDVRGDLMSARHRVSKLLLRSGRVWSGGTAWTGAHHAWLRRQTFDQPAVRSRLRGAGRRAGGAPGTGRPGRRRRPCPAATPRALPPPGGRPVGLAGRAKEGGMQVTNLDEQEPAELHAAPAGTRRPAMRMVAGNPRSG